LIVTEYKTIKQEHDTSLLEVKLVTGKTHQIRAHFNFINYPLVGEQKYTKKEFSKINNQYQALISYKIYFNFKNNAGILQYLDKKTFILKNCNC
jgi:23S rRNA pseudouridine955/2504/2580 synthase